MARGRREPRAERPHARRAHLAAFRNEVWPDAELPGFSARNSDAVTIVVDAYSHGFALTKSRADARRLIEQGSVQLNGEKIRDPKAVVALESGQILRLDKTHAVRIS